MVANGTNWTNCTGWGNGTNGTTVGPTARLASLEARAAGAQANYLLLSTSTDAAWVMGCAFLVFSMQMGFTLLEAGCVKANLRSMLMKNVVGTALCTIMWWFVGNAFMRGNMFSNFGAIAPPFEIFGSFVTFFWDLSYVCSASTVVSGAMAERVKFLGYCAYVLWLSGFIYPFVAHWVWTDRGFLSLSNPTAVFPMLDFAGCGAVHLLGGSASLIGAWMIGPRPGVFVNQITAHSKKEHIIAEHLAATLSLYAVIGIMLLWICWYGFNCGSAGGIVGKSNVVGLVAVNTTVAPMVGGIVASLVSYIQYRLFKVDIVLMGILSGLVSITGAGPYVQTYMVVPIAIGGFLSYHFLAWLLLKVGIDDPVSAFPIHFGCGFWGLLAAGFFQDKALTGVDSWATQMRNQFVGAVIIAGWTMALSFLGLCVLHFLFGGLRHMDAEAEFRRDIALQNCQGPRGIVTLLFTGIQNCSILWEADEDSMDLAQALHNQIFRDALQAHHGFEVKTEEDVFMCAFSKAVDCARFCVAVQRQLMEAKWPKGLYANKGACIEDDGSGTIIWKGLRVRMGFHTGEPNPQENPLTNRTDYFGKDVNYAARVSGIGVGGQVVLSSASVKELLPFCQDAAAFKPTEPFGLSPGVLYPLPALECSVEYIGRWPLKGITLPDSDGEHLYQLRPFGLQTRQFAAGTMPAEPLPSMTGSFRQSRSLQRQPTPRSMAGSEMNSIFSSPRCRRIRDGNVIAEPAPVMANPVTAWIPEDVLSSHSGTVIVTPPAMLHARTYAVYVNRG